MIKIENIEVFGFKGALRGMRNPLDSWDRADTIYHADGSIRLLGPNDEDLIKRLTKAGASHRKFLRMIHVQADVTAPLYWWKEYDTYKIATTANSCSTMHKIHEYEFTTDMFTTEHLDQIGLNILDAIINYLNYYRKNFIISKKKDKDAWYKMIQMLPTSFLQKRTIDLNYENILPMLRDRHTHKQDEWVDFSNFMYNNLPLMSMLYNAAYGGPMNTRTEDEKKNMVPFEVAYVVRNSGKDINLIKHETIYLPQKTRSNTQLIIDTKQELVRRHPYLPKEIDIISVESASTHVGWGSFDDLFYNGTIKLDGNICPSNMFPDFSTGVIKTGEIKCDSTKADGININTNFTLTEESAKMVEENIKKEIFKAVNVVRNHQ